MSTLPLVFAFQPEEKVQQGVVRLLGEISASSIALVHRSKVSIGEAVHDGRLLIKRLRALLWFARPALGPTAYDRVRSQLRQAAGLLAGQRDLAVTRTTLENLAQKAPDNRDRASVHDVFRSAAGRSTFRRENERTLHLALKRSMRVVARSAEEVQCIAVGRTEWPEPTKRVKKAFSAMRKAGEQARETGRDIDFHTWRKKAKKLVYQLELTQSQLGPRKRHAARQVAKLQEKLGDFHDRVIAQDRLRQMEPFPPPANRVLDLLNKNKRHLQRQVRRIARKLE
jgi:CHAD domain-containing protein